MNARVVVWARAFAVWLIIILVESVHGIFRGLVLEPRLGDFHARQVSVFTGAILILTITYLFIDWIGTATTRQLAVVGVLWVLLTLAFEIGLGRIVLGYSWDRMLSDFDIARGGFLGIGFVIMVIAPRVVWSFRRMRRLTA